MRPYDAQNRQVKKSLADEVGESKATLIALEKEVPALRKENKRQLQRLQHRDKKLLALCKDGIYLPDRDGDSDDDNLIAAGETCERKAAYTISFRPQTLVA
jgi:DNA-binding XRE family transcriptional regulator